MADKAIFEYWNCGLPVGRNFTHMHLTEGDAQLCECKQAQNKRREDAWQIRKAKIEANREKKRLAEIDVERKLVENVPKEFLGMKDDGLALVINRGVLKAMFLKDAINAGVFQDYHVGYNSVMEWFNGR